MINAIRATTLAKLGNDISKILTNFFIDGIAFMLLKGRNDLRALKPFKPLLSTEGSISKIADITTTKSKMFQPSLRYEVL